MGKIDSGTVVSGLSAGLGMLNAGVNAFKSNAATKDTSIDESNINTTKNTQFGSNSMNDLLSQFDSMALGRTNYTGKELGLSGGQIAMNTINGMLGGAASGASTGDKYAALGGLATGFIGGIGGAFVGKNKAERKADELNERASEANRIYLNNFNNSVSNLHNSMFNKALLNIAAKGGPIFTHGGVFDNNITHINNGNIHELNPNEGVQIGVDNNGVPNLVEEGEVIWKDYVFSNRMKVPNSVKRKLGLSGKRKLSYSEVAEKFEDNERPNDPISKDTSNAMLSRLMQSQEEQRQLEQLKKQQLNQNIIQPQEQQLIPQEEQQIPLQQENLETIEDNNMNSQFAKGGRLGNLYEGEGPSTQKLGFNPISPALNKKLLTSANNRVKVDLNPNKYSPLKPKSSLLSQVPQVKNSNFNFSNFAKYAPAIGSGIQALTDAFGLTNKPDYSIANELQNTTKNLRQVSTEPIGNYLTYKPFDRNYYNNQLLAQSNATREAVQNQAINSASAMTGLLNADYNSQLGLADMARKAEEYNRSQEQAVAQFNRDTNKSNIENSLRASMANMENNKIMSQIASNVAQMKQQEDLASSAAISNNLSNFYNNIQNVSKDIFNRDQADMLIKSGVYGTLSQKPKNWTDKEWQDYLIGVQQSSATSKAKGGKLNKKRRGGLTY